MRIFAVPDIHGRLDLLNKLMEKLYVEQKLDLSADKLIFLGDMVDRGPDSCDVIERIKSLQEDHPDNVIALAGNHEWMMIHYYIRGANEDKDLWEWNGGLQTIESYKRAGHSKATDDHLRWLAFLPLKHIEKNYFISHAPAPSEGYRLAMNKGATEFTPDELTWTYHSDEKGLARNHKNGIIGVSGHIHRLREGIMSPRFYDHHYYLDCGAGCSPKAPLVAVNLDTKEVIYAWP